MTERVSDTLVRLPFFNGIKPAELVRVVEAIHEFEC